MVAKKGTNKPLACKCGTTLDSLLVKIELHGEEGFEKRRIEFCSTCDAYVINDKKFKRETREGRAVRAALERYNWPGYMQGYIIKKYEFVQ